MAVLLFLCKIVRGRRRFNSKQYQERVIGANDSCPLMCKRKFKDNGMTGFPLDEVNRVLGTTKVRTC